MGLQRQRGERSNTWRRKEGGGGTGVLASSEVNGEMARKSLRGGPDRRRRGGFTY